MLRIRVDLQCLPFAMIPKSLHLYNNQEGPYLSEDFHQKE